MMLKSSEGIRVLSLLAGSWFSEVTNTSVSKFVWIRCESSDLRTVPLIPTRQCSVVAVTTLSGNQWKFLPVVRLDLIHEISCASGAESCEW